MDTRWDFVSGDYDDKQDDRKRQPDLLGRLPLPPPPASRRRVAGDGTVGGGGGSGPSRLPIPARNPVKQDVDNRNNAPLPLARPHRPELERLLVRGGTGDRGGGGDDNGPDRRPQLPQLLDTRDPFAAMPGLLELASALVPHNISLLAAVTVMVGNMTRPPPSILFQQQPEQQHEQQRERMLGRRAPTAPKTARAETHDEAMSPLDASYRTMRLDYVLLRHLAAQGHAAAALELLADLAGVSGDDLAAETLELSSSVVLEQEEDKGEEEGDEGQTGDEGETGGDGEGMVEEEAEPQQQPPQLQLPPQHRGRVWVVNDDGQVMLAER